MDAISLFAGMLIALAVGAALGYLYARSKLAGLSADLTGQAKAAEERARGAQERAALVDGQLAERAEGRLGAANARAAGELESRRAAVEHLVQPLRETLAKVEGQLKETEAARQLSHAALAEQVTIARQSSERLREQTQALVTALRRPEARGRRGEMQLRRVVELAGMSPRCDFDEQVGLSTPDGTLRPDMVVRLAGDKNIVVDSKVTLAAYLKAAQASDEAVQALRLDAHARHLREHIDRLAAKGHWNAPSPSPGVVVF